MKKRKRETNKKKKMKENLQGAIKFDAPQSVFAVTICRHFTRGFPLICGRRHPRNSVLNRLKLQHRCRYRPWGQAWPGAPSLSVYLLIVRPN